MAAAWKNDYPPLLSLGWHRMDVAALRRICVDQFPASITRPRLMSGLEQVVNRLNGSGLHLEVWVDGSFLTQKLNPDDSDIAVKVQGEQFDAAPANQQEPIRWATGDGPWTDHRCDCYPFAVYANGHPLHETGEWQHAYWLTKFGHNRAEQPKGLAVLTLPFVII